MARAGTKPWDDRRNEVTRATRMHVDQMAKFPAGIGFKPMAEHLALDHNLAAAPGFVGLEKNDFRGRNGKAQLALHNAVHGLEPPGRWFSAGTAKALPPPHPLG